MKTPDQLQLEAACKAARALYANAPPGLQAVGAGGAGAVLSMAKRVMGRGMRADDAGAALCLALGYASLAVEDEAAWEASTRDIKRWREGEKP